MKQIESISQCYMVAMRQSHLHHLLKGVQVLLHAVVDAQVGHEVAGVHAVQAVEEGVDASVQMDGQHTGAGPCTGGQI